MSDNDANDASTKSFTRPGFVLAALFLAVTLVGGIVVVVTGRSAPRAAPPPAASTTAAPPPATPAPAGASCPPTTPSQQPLTAAPPAISWQVFKGMALPSSATAGPLVTEGEIARCFAHTPTGALIAATQLGFRYSVVTDWTQISRQLVDGPGKAAFMAQRSASPHPAAPRPGQVGQIAGFRMLTYDPAVAVVQLAIRLPAQNPTQNSFGVSALTVKWQGQDWHLELQPDGIANTDPQILPSINGYIPWGGL
ncbi:hypothetical protein ACSNOI_39250 [Actinomadura kijaniata]|uniref:hypothetical protein n=1 Tax=Actinomadura kijaniata TaxID=46161 RepID=UPI003F1C4718